MRGNKKINKLRKVRQEEETQIGKKTTVEIKWLYTTLLLLAL